MKTNWLGWSVAVVAVIFFLIAVVACGEGQTSAPSINKIEDKLEVVDVELPDGRTVPCIYYAADGNGNYTSYSWLVLDCDWDNAR